MRSTLKPGLVRTETVTVDEARAITFLGDALRVYSTPSMVSDIEYACLRLIDDHLDPDESSVGAHVCVDHLAATPIGQPIEVRVRVESVEGRAVELSARVSDALRTVGQGRHRRVVIDVARHADRLAEQRAQY